MKKILILGLVSVMALAILGVGYATWQKVLVIDGTVNTGSIGAVWTNVVGSDNELEQTGGKDESSIVCETDGVTLTATVVNGYPSITYRCDYDILSSGTVPIHVDAPRAETADTCLDVVMPAPGPVQLHPDGSGDGTTASGYFTVHMQQICDQGLTGANALSFGAEIVAHQYNQDAE